MNITVRDFLGSSYNHGYIMILDINEGHDLLWKGKEETIDNHIDWRIRDMKVVKWGWEDKGIVIYVNKENK